MSGYRAKVIGQVVRIVVVLMVFFLLPTVTLQAEEKGDTEVSLMAGYRQDSLDWNIRGNTGPNVLSELTWRDLKSYQIRGEVISITPRGIYFRGTAAYGWVYDGQNQDSDYAGDNRTLEFSRSINGVDGSRLMDFKGGVGFEFPFGKTSQHRVVPVIGYAYHSQDLRMKDGRQVVSNSAYYDLIDPDPSRDVPPTGPISGLNSSYKAEWQGLWLGVDFIFDFEASGVVKVNIEQHWPEYSATANWNLRPDLRHPVSFEHDANGQGLVLELAWKSVTIYQGWQWGANLSWQNWTTNSGTDRTYVTDYYYPGCTPYCVATGRLNEVNWTSSQINITLSREIKL